MNDAVCQQWYEWVRTLKRHRERARVEDMLRNISLSRKPEHVKIKVLATGIKVARLSSGLPFTEDDTLSGKGIIGSMVSKPGEDTQSRWLLYLGEDSGKEEREAFNRWLAIEVRTTAIYRHHKMAAAWFGVSRKNKAEARYAQRACVNGAF